MSPARRVAGTTLIEVLVVIVIFLVGILAVVQIFPKGFQILILGRNNSVATALSRDEIERLKAHSDQVPEMIVASSFTGSQNTIDPDHSPDDLGPACDEILADGSCVRGEVNQGDWTRFTGPNAIRHIVGEGREIPAPRLVGTGTGLYGGLMVLNFGPVDYDADTFAVYGNDMTPRYGLPAATDQKGEDEFFVDKPNEPGIAVYLPTGPITLPNGNPNPEDRNYFVSFSAYVPNGSGGFVKRDYTDRLITVGRQAPAANGEQPLAGPFALGNYTGGDAIASVDPGSLRVRRGFVPLANNADWEEHEAYSCKLLNPSLGVLLFSPYAFGQYVSTPDGRVPLRARVTYDVYDWRILREEFRFPLGQQAQHQLAVGSIKVGGAGGFDGRNQTLISVLEGPSSPTFSANNSRSDFFVLVDLDTGGVYMEKDKNVPVTTPNVYISVNKSNGLITVRDLDDSTPGTQANLMLPDGQIQTNVTIDNRAVRALYMARNEFAVQVLKAPSLYNITYGRPGVGQYYIGGSGAFGEPTRIYFPKADAGRKVTIGVINYRRSGDASPRQILDQDFVIRYPVGSNPSGLPCIDVADVDSLATTLDATADARSFGYAVSGVKGASVAVRTVWNPQFFRLGEDTAQNMTKVNQWGRGWRRSTNETYLEQGDISR